MDLVTNLIIQSLKLETTISISKCLLNVKTVLAPENLVAKFLLQDLVFFIFFAFPLKKLIIINNDIKKNHNPDEINTN